MANKKARIKSRSIRDKPGIKARQRSSSGGLFRWLWRLLLLALVLTVLFWQWEGLVSWASDVTQGATGLFGWGLALIAVVAIIIIGIISILRLEMR